MRRYRSAFILLGILALMLGGYFFYTMAWPLISPPVDDGGDEPAGTASESISLIDRKSDEIEELTINYLSETYVAVKEKVMEKSEGSDTEKEVVRWRLSNRSDIPVESSKLSTAATNFCVITSSKIVEENAADLAQYGFSGPGAATAVGKFTDGTEMTLEIGDKNPTNDAYYVRVNGGNTVYLGSSYSSEKLMMKKTDIAKMDLFALEESDVKRMEMERSGSPLFAAWRKGDYEWELERPVIAPLNTTAQGMIFEAVKEVSASEYIEMGASDLAQYGLDKPRYTMLFEMAEDGGDPVELIIGAEKTARTSVYAMMGGTKDVFTLNIDAFGFLDKPIKEFVDAFAYIVNINAVSHIQADFDGRSVMIDIDAEIGGDDDKFVVDGVDVSDLKNDKDRSIFRLFYQALIGVTIYDIEPDSSPSGTPEITFLYELKEEPKTMLVEFVPKDERLYYVFRNKAYAGIIVEKRLFDRPEEGLRPLYAIMKEAMDKAAAEAGA